MPTYEFRCPTGHDFENFYRSISAAPTEVLCPTCGKIAARQLSAGGGLLFKGSGFYITDYGKDGKKSQEAATAARDTAGNSGGDETSPAKPESTSGTQKASTAGGESPAASKPAPDTKPGVASPKATSSKKPKVGE